MYIDWAYKTAEGYRKRGYVVIVVNYAIHKGACCNYFHLIYCEHPKRIGQFLGYVFLNFNLTSNSDQLIIMGYSLGKKYVNLLFCYTENFKFLIYYLGGVICGFACCELHANGKEAKTCVCKCLF